MHDTQGNAQSQKVAADRYEQLDALRGIAALLVVFHHAYQTDPVWPQIVRFTPARLLLNGRPSVIFFFVLSGFVLAYGLRRRDGQSYGTFVLRRVARIYLPYAVAGGLAVAGCTLFAAKSVPLAAITFQEMWPSPPDVASVFGHFALTGGMRAEALNVPSWSLVYELRISLLIPLLVLLVDRSRVGTGLVTGVLVLLAETWLRRSGAGPVIYSAEGLAANIAATIHFTGCFVVGVLLANAAATRAAWLFAMPRWGKILAAITGTGLMFVFRDESCTVGAALILILALNSATFKRWLDAEVLRGLGRISFSLYLTHMIVLESIVRALAGHMSLGLSVIVGLAVAIPVAMIFYRWVEVPSHRLAQAIRGKERSLVSRYPVRTMPFADKIPCADRRPHGADFA